MDLGYVKRESKREVVCCSVFVRKAVRTPVSQGAVLRSKRADLEIRNFRGATVLHHAAIEAIGDSVITMLLDNGADINAKDYRAGTPLTWALQVECETVTVSRMKLFIENHVEIEFLCRPWVSRSYLGTKCDL